jgi:hypothetical protein
VIVGLGLLVIMVGGDGNDAGGSDGHDPCGHIPAVEATTAAVATEGRTAAESAKLEATVVWGGNTSTTTAVRAKAATRGDGAVYNHRGTAGTEGMTVEDG